MRNLTEHNVTDAILRQMSDAMDPRLRGIMASLVTHLHAFVREVEPTPEEWMAGIEFLTSVGKMCDARRQEFVLLSDTLGVSALVDIINNRSRDGATQSSLLGPFYRAGAPELPMAADMAADVKGHRVIVSGRVLSADRRPIAGAVLDVWQAAPNGLYDVQDPDQPDMNLRARYRADHEGRYEFRTVEPSFYGIPSDGPVGAMLRAVGRHPNRPAHIHVIVSAGGHVPLTTALFTEGDRYLDSDAVLGVRSGLIVRYVRHDSLEEAARRQVPAPFYTVDHDFVLKPV
jgi:hydroxyquinol 1,2-dioxygenase